jgi:hypothetical protein
LRNELAIASKGELFDLLRPHLLGDPDAVPYASIAAQLKMTVVAVKVTVHRLRKRYGELLRQEVAQTLADPADADPIYPYMKSVQVYRCPADNSKVKAHPELSRTRSYAADIWLNSTANTGTAIDEINGVPEMPRKYSCLPTPGPGRIFVLVEEHEEFIDDGAFSFPNPWRPNGDVQWDDFPADRHNTMPLSLTAMWTTGVGNGKGGSPGPLRNQS